MESRNETTNVSYNDAFKTTDSNNITTSFAPQYRDFLTTSLSINKPLDWEKLAPWIGIALTGLAFVFTIARGR